MPNNLIKGGAETVICDVQTSASDNLEGPIVIIGNLIIKDVIPEKYQKTSGSINLQVKQLDSIRLRESPSHVIIYVGKEFPTNTGKTCSTKLANKIKAKFLGSKVGIERHMMKNVPAKYIFSFVAVTQGQLLSP